MREWVVRRALRAKKIGSKSTPAVGWDHVSRRFAPKLAKPLQLRNTNLILGESSINSAKILIFGTKYLSSLRDVHQPVADGIDHQFGRLMDTQRVHDVGAVDGHRIRTQIQLAGNLLIREPGDNELKHLKLANRQTGLALPLEIRASRDLRIQHFF